MSSLQKQFSLWKYFIRVEMVSSSWKLFLPCRTVFFLAEMVSSLSNCFLPRGNGFFLVELFSSSRKWFLSRGKDFWPMHIPSGLPYYACRIIVELVWLFWKKMHDIADRPSYWKNATVTNVDPQFCRVVLLPWVTKQSWWVHMTWIRFRQIWAFIRTWKTAFGVSFCVEGLNKL